MKNRMTKLSAAAAILIVGAVILSQFAFPSVTFAKAIEPILNARTLIYDFVVGSEGSGPVMHDIVSGDRIRRTISNMPDITMVLDTGSARMLHMDSSRKQAFYFDMEGALQMGTESFLEFLRETIRQVQADPEFSAQKVGTRQIDGRKAVGFAAGNANSGFTVWADAETSLPVPSRAFNLRTAAS